MKKVGIIGCGWIFQNEHIFGYLASKEGIIHGFFDLSQELAINAMTLYREGMKKRLENATTEEERILCEKSLLCKYYNNADQLLSDVDAVDICTPPQFHMLYAKKAADLNKAVLCEKPLARSYLDAKIALESLKKVSFYLFTQVIYNPIFKKGKEIIDSGKIGEIVSMRCCHATLDLNHTVEKEAFWDPLKSGGGALKDIGPHAFSVLRYWLGKEYNLKSVKDVGITTQVSERTIQNKANFPVIIDDIALVEAKWENKEGRIVDTKLEAYWLDKKNLPKELKYGLYHEIKGTKGTLIFPNGTLGLILGKKPYFGIHVFFKIIHNDGTIEKISMPQPSPHTETKIAIDDFLADRESRSPAWYGEDMMILLDSAYLSKKRGGSSITPSEFFKYCEQFESEKDPSEQGKLLIQDLFGL